MTPAVLDTNCLISTLFWGGLPKHALNLARSGRIQLITSEHLLGELRDVLTREGKPFRLSDDEAGRVISHIRTIAHIVAPTERVSACRDTDDNAVIECAIAGKAEYIVTGDADLIELRQYEGVSILNVREFLAAIGELPV